MRVASRLLLPVRYCRSNSRGGLRDKDARVCTVSTRTRSLPSSYRQPEVFRGNGPLSVCPMVDEVSAEGSVNIEVRNQGSGLATNIRGVDPCTLVCRSLVYGATHRGVVMLSRPLMAIPTEVYQVTYESVDGRQYVTRFSPVAGVKTPAQWVERA
jgi:hypothetical protein